MSGPIVGADLGSRHRLAPSAVHIDDVAPTDSGPSDVAEGMLPWMGKTERKGSNVWAMCSFKRALLWLR